ncbi:Heavy-metal-associated domain protein [Roseomonas sp. TAS13]|jgi:copper chaperone|uniref:Copper chaperone n=1 Tax=Muricoccus roseus TaxID=198092 RepID=A0A1M6RLL3_9PROT|nr:MULTISPECIES: heavy-metal-associated domain-containing protein [Roseomonas]PZR08347.1 MAG: copper chaperone [Azospirillum brasilense]USQ74523.1 heavy-metal-associated domain-containing protein [Roseomonas mucosa]GAV35109.1 Heavy-metal-associated domain protein [Roseomonas sp. TAS13]SHK33353.1 copper chaperone [Roseomonas rosea]
MMRFTIENMNCGGCAKGVTATVKAADPSAEIEVQLDRKEITVSGGRTDSDALRGALQAAGWKAETAPA